MKPILTRLPLIIGGLVLLLVAAPVTAQGQCGPVASIDFPVDRTQFRLAQAFGTPSPRHQGRYHTGDDYYGGRGTSYLQPVHAIADGRVTYSAANGWGRDGGVVIIEHTFPDGSIAYSQYGHMEEVAERPFPARYSCVKAGDVIGSVGNARPAPHLHFEIRTNQPDIPGPGYTWDFPTALGWLEPTAFVVNWQAWLQSSHRWHVELSANWEIPPVELSDHSLVYLDDNRLRRLTPDGRILWRANLNQPAVGLFAYEDAAAVAYADGTMQPFHLDGSLGETWQAETPLQQQLLAAGELLLFQTPEQALVALGADRKTVAWRLGNVLPVGSGFAAPNLLALQTADNGLLAVSPLGQRLDTATLREPGNLSALPDGTLLAYTRGGLWRVGADGTWSLLREDTPPGGAGGSALMNGGGELFLLSRGGSRTAPTNAANATLHAYNRDGLQQWQADLPDVAGQVTLAQYDNVLLLLSSAGNMMTFNAASGTVCQALRVFGGGPVWHSLGDDGILRLAIGAQFTGWDWAELTQGCG